MGGGFEKGGNVATFAEVSFDRKSGEVKVVRLVTAFECGAIVNPDGLRNQLEGANIMALGGTLFESIEFTNGQILNGRFSDYRLPRFSDVPVIETVMLDRKDIPQRVPAKVLWWVFSCDRQRHISTRAVCASARCRLFRMA